MVFKHRLWKKILKAKSQKVTCSGLPPVRQAAFVISKSAAGIEALELGRELKSFREVAHDERLLAEP